MFSHHEISQRRPFRSLYTKDGQRKYLSEKERSRFIGHAKQQPRQVRLLCLVLALSGCRLSEALNLTKEDVLEIECAILIRTLKKRDKIIYRQIPLPAGLIYDLRRLGQKRNGRLFLWQRTQALQHIKRVMKLAAVDGVRATARGLRHTFGVHGILRGIPLTLLQRWFGHASIETTAIYTQVLGPEEREIAKKMW
ncbi:MAG: site-specific integrase [Pseudomonadota bacterium]